MKKIYNNIKNIGKKAAIAMFLTLPLGGVGGGVLLTSCSDLLDQKPYGQFTSDQIDAEAAEGLLASAYAGLEAHYFGNNEAFAGPSTNWIFDVRSDDAYKGGGATSMEQNIHQMEISNLTSDNVSFLNKWQNNFYAISRVHKAMLALQSQNGFDKEIAELKFLRAYYYFDLVRLFEHIPYLDENSDPNTVSNQEYSQEDIYKFICKDLDEAYEGMYETAKTPGRVGRYAAAALHAKVSAQTSNWTETEKWSKIVIDSKQYELYDNYLDMSKIEFNNRKESILAIQCSTANNNAHINWSNLLNTTYSEGDLYGTGDDFFLGSQNLVNAFRTDQAGLPYLDGATDGKNVTTDFEGNVDPRLDFTVGRIGIPFRGYTYTAAWCRAYDIYGEYSGKKGLISPDDPTAVRIWPWGCNSLNFCLIRYADIVLLYAESLIEQNKELDTAREYINMVRAKAARSVDPDYAPIDIDPINANYKVGLYSSTNWNQNYARKAVHMERRLELAMEGQRWFDLVRWGNVTETMNAYFKSESKLRPYLSEAQMSDDEIYLPTPLSEITNSNGLYK